MIVEEHTLYNTNQVFHLVTFFLCHLFCLKTTVLTTVLDPEELIEEKTGIPTMTAEDPMTAVAIGTGRYVEFLSGKRD